MIRLWELGSTNITGFDSAWGALVMDWPAEIVRVRDKEGLSWRAIATKLKIPVMTAVDAYRTCTEIASPEPPVAPAKTKRKKTAA